MTSTDTNVSESNDSCNNGSASRKVGRQTKSKNISSESYVKQDQSSAMINVSVVNESKEKKLFPIFNLSAKHVSVDKIYDRKEPLRKNEGPKCTESKVISVESDILTDSPVKNINKATRKKRRTMAVDLNIKSDEKSLKGNLDLNYPIANTFIEHDELPLVEIENAERETFEYLNSEIQKDVLDSNQLVKTDESIKRNSVRKSTIEENLSQLSDSKNSEPSTSIQVLIKHRNELKFDKSHENKCISNKEPIISIQKEKIGCITFKNKVILMDNSTNTLKSTEMKIRENELISAQIPFTHVLKDQLIDVFPIKTKSVEISPLENDSLQVSVDSCSSELKSNKLKSRKKKFLKNKVESTLVVKDDVLENASSRRRSLRSKGIRNNQVNYSEIISCDIVEKQKCKNLLKNKSGRCFIDIESDTANQKSNFDAEVAIVNDNSKQTNAKKTKNLKEDCQLFSIFSSPKLQSNEMKNKLRKRKAKAVEEIDVKSNAEAKINQSFKRKKAKNQLNLLPTFEPICIDLKKVCEDVICVTSDNETESTSESSKDSDVCIIQNSICVGTTSKESRKKNGRKCTDMLDLKITNKPKFTDNDNICFPLLSHLTISNTTFPETPNRYHINDEISNDVVVPIWRDVIGFIDSDCTQIIKAGVDSYSLAKPKIDELPDVESVIVDENNTLWTDSAQESLIKEKNNKGTVAEIKSWLYQWKNKFSCYSKTSNDNSESYSSDSDNDFIYNGIIISGIPGSGKTSLVFALANELGFTVLEVNTSSCRNGRNISHQLKEALESYHVEGIKVEKSITKTVFGEIKEKKISKNKEDIDLSEMNKTKDMQSFFKAKNTDLQKDMLLKGKQNITNFFKVGDKPEEIQNLKSKSKTKCSKNKTENESKKSKKKLESVSLKNESIDMCDNRQNLKCKSLTLNLKKDIKSKLDKLKKNSETLNLKNENSCKISSLTIILFDDVDVVFEEDEGFWSTVKGFLKISKKPVILTVGRNLSIVKSILNSGIKIFNMKPVSKDVAVLKLKEDCKKYSREDTSVNFELLTSQNICDLRRSTLNAQFWTQTPKLIKKVDYETSGSDLSAMPISKLIHVNSFLTGDLNFSTKHIQKLLFDCLPMNFSNAILQYQSLGYDILFSNIFNIFYKIKLTDCEGLWQNLTLKFQNLDSTAKDFSDSEMWKEACELYKRKKKALRNGSCSTELNNLADAISDFSYADSIKGQSCNKFQWTSVLERVKMWTAGLPICLDQNLEAHKDVLDIISLIHIFLLRKLQNATSLKYSESSDDMPLDLEHPFLRFDQSFAYKTEDDLECISSVLPPFQLLNKTALTLDYLSTIKIMCQTEENRQLNSGKRSGRFLHYFDSISLYVDRKTF